MDMFKNLVGGNKQKPAKEGQQDDYVDKAFGVANKKGGFGLSRDTQEKITDGARSAVEKLTGKKIDPKISN
ncbi:unnamed protein product [Clonostachys rosea f. rosea IK726]|uniref:Uncharacterized protein n=2 Tax=Bionectria ochroleuca TaxID=29856 RepID=A0A0B7K196_BIOOC|nr:unnamed protein product [Clonostachys rosea f. rosea IK726]